MPSLSHTLSTCWHCCRPGWDERGFSLSPPSEGRTQKCLTPCGRASFFGLSRVCKSLFLSFFSPKNNVGQSVAKMLRLRAAFSILQRHVFFLLAGLTTKPTAGDHHQPFPSFSASCVGADSASYHRSEPRKLLTWIVAGPLVPLSQSGFCFQRRGTNTPAHPHRCGVTV